MKNIKKIATVVLGGILLCGANFSSFAAEKDTDREVDEIYQTCYSTNCTITIEEDEETYKVYSPGKTISWEADKVDEDERQAYTSHNVFARKYPNTADKTELCLKAGTAIKQVAISENGWDIIEYEDELYFMWYEYITDIKPVVVVKTTVKKETTPAKVNNDAAATPQETTTEEVSTEATEETPQDATEETTEETTYTDSTSTCVGTFQLTAYTWTGNPCADGVYPSSGYTAACNDSRLWHHWVYIEGYGTYYIHDTGGMASNVIDIYMDSYDSCIQFGRRSATVYIVD